MSGGRPGDWSCPECNAHNFASRNACFKCHEPKPAGEGGGGYSGGGGYNGGGGGGYNGGGGYQRPGDWSCPDCNAHNFASRVACFKCHAPKPAGGDSGRGGFQNSSSNNNNSNNNNNNDDDNNNNNNNNNYGRSNNRYNNNSRGGGNYRGGGGYRNNSRPGDWICTACSANNFASRTACFKCEEPKPAGGQDGGGYQGQSGGYQRGRGGYQGGGNSYQNNNYQNNNYRSNNGGGYSGGGYSSNRSSRPGDWLCSACNGNNFASRTECYKCQEPKPDDAASSFQQQMRPGDWSCPGCAAHNFASRRNCFKCNEPKPEEGMGDTDSAGIDDGSGNNDLVGTESVPNDEVPGQQQQPDPAYTPSAVREDVGGW